MLRLKKQNQKKKLKWISSAIDYVLKTNLK